MSNNSIPQHLYAIIRRCGNGRKDMARVDAALNIMLKHRGTTWTPCIAIVGFDRGPSLVEFPDDRVDASARLTEELTAIGCEIADGESQLNGIVERERASDAEIARRLAEISTMLSAQPDLYRLGRNSARLSAEPISRAQQLRSMPYSEYLQTPEWQNRRKRKLESSGYACQVCNASGVRLDVHHRTYERRGNETSGDLVVLCRDCHEIFHNSGRLSVNP